MPALGAEIVAIANAPDPVPAQTVDGLEPGRTETGIGNQDRLHGLGQQCLELGEKRALHARIGKVAQGMDLLVYRQRPPTQRHRRAQQLPAAIGGEVAPVDDDHRLTPHAHQPAGKRLIDLEALNAQVPVAEQSIHALDAVLDVCRADERATQFGQRQPPAAHRSGHHRQDHRQARGVDVWATRSKQLLYDIERMHGAVSFEGWSPSKET